VAIAEAGDLSGFDIEIIAASGAVSVTALSATS